MFMGKRKKIVAMALAGMMSFGIAGTAMTASVAEAAIKPAYEDGTHNQYSHRLKEEDRVEGCKLLIIQLVDEQRQPLAEATIRAKGNQWQQYHAVFTAHGSCAKAQLDIVGVGCQKIAIDKVSMKKHQ